MPHIHWLRPTHGERVRAARPTLRRAAPLGALAVALACGVLTWVAVLAASAPASAATPMALDAPENGTGAAPLIAYDPTTQTTYVVWADPTKSAIDLCILPASAAACEGGTPVLLEDSLFEGDNFAGPGGLVVLPGGEVAVIGDTGNSGSIAWISPAGGSGFLSKGGGLQNKGEPVSPVELYYTLGNAAALSSSDVGLLDNYGNFFADTSLTSLSPEPPATTNPGGKFPRKALETAGPEIAAEPAPPPAPAGTDVVVGVGDNYAGPPEALPGCLNKEGTGFGVSAGKVDGTSKTAGTLNAEGLPAYGVLACSAETPVLAQGGTEGIGLVEQEGDGFEGTGPLYTVDYRPFLATSTGGAFGAPVELADVTHQSLGGVINLDLSEDSGTGVYATWQDEQGLLLDYSANGGAGWEGATVVPEQGSGQDNPVIVGTGDGNAEIAYVGNPGTGPQVFLQSVNYAALVAANETPPTPAADTLTTSQTSGATTGATITISAGTIGETDRATLSGVNAASATGTVTYGLYSNPSCTSSSEVAKSAATVTGGVAAASGAVSTALAPGSYYWQAIYSGDANNAASVSACGSEVLKVVPATTVEGGGTTSGTTVTVTITCASTPCTVTITITTGSGASKASVARKKGKAKGPKTIVLATGTFTITTPGAKKLTVRLTKAGKQQLRRDHGHLKANISVSEKTAGGLELTTKTIDIVTVKPKHKHKK